MERADAIVVGARCAGSATAIALARAGRRVVVLDRSRFPSDTLSTHLLFAGGVAELRRLGALEAVGRLGAPPLPEAMMVARGHAVRARYTPVEGIANGLCVRRPGLDAALVETARAAGADVRERTTVTALEHDRTGRVAGVRVRDRAGREAVLRAPLVVGADGRRSTVARLVGADAPWAADVNGRLCAFAYCDDVHAGARGIAAQWREGVELGTAFPCDGDRVLVLVMPPRERAGAFRRDPAAAWEQTVARIPGLQERLEGCERATRVRVAVDTTSFFRRAIGPGWALPGDAGHFKDPVTAQGIRDALRFGRLLGEAAAPVLDDAPRLDRALRAWERRRDRECRETYAWTLGLARAGGVGPLEHELYRAAETDPVLAGAMLDVFSRVRRPTAVMTPARALGLAGRALRAGAGPGDVAGELRDGLGLQAKRARLAFSRKRGVTWDPVRDGLPEGAEGRAPRAARAARA